MEGMDWMNNNNMVEEVNPLKKQDFYFELPQELIAQDPLTDRAASRLLVKKRGSTTTGYFLICPIICARGIVW